ncbi:MAG: DUF1122 family protein [Candidatus Hodarchaeota archaeon]
MQQQSQKLETLVKKFAEGIGTNNHAIYAKRVDTGRFIEERDLDIYLKGGAYETHLVYLKVFFGRKPYYRPWAEVFGINSTLNVEEKKINFFDSLFESKLLSILSQSLGPGEPLYIEYFNDKETAQQLIRGVPYAISRLGYKLLLLGFTWFKDWYFPEGFMEGGQKLQGIKPLNDDVKDRQVQNIYTEVKEFLKSPRVQSEDPYMPNAVERAYQLQSRILNI